MAGHGFEEAQAGFVGFAEEHWIGEVRRFGPCGPAYEVIATAPGNEVEILVIQSRERLSYPIADMLADPVAETVP